MALEQLLAEIIAFRDERDWAQFHTPKNLAAALAIEAAELQEQLLWKTEDEIQSFAGSDRGHQRLSDEVADVFIYTLLFAHAVGIDVEAATRVKLRKNADKYPADRARGRATKYSELDTEEAS